MNWIQLVSVVLQLALLDSAQSLKICDFADTECITLGARNNYKSLVSGIEGMVKPSDPLYQNLINDEQPTLKYEVSNATLTGMKNCLLTQLKMDDAKLAYEYDLQCPKLVLKLNYDVIGVLDTVDLDGKGLATYTLNNYMVNVKGNYAKFTSEKDRKLHLSTEHNAVKFEPKEKMGVEIQGTLNSDKAKSDLAKAYIAEHWEVVEKLLRDPILSGFMTQFLDNTDDYLTNVPIEKILFMP